MVELVGLELVTHHPVIEPSLRQSRERKFLMQRQAGKNGLFTPQRPVQRLASYTKSPHSSALNAIRASEVRALKTGWWCAQSYANRSRLDIRLRTGNFLQNSANNRLSGGLWRLRIGNSTEIPDSCRQAQALSSYCAKQVIEAEYWH